MTCTSLSRSTPFCTPTSRGMMMGTSPGYRPKATSTSATGDASQRSSARTPHSKQSLEKNGTCLQHYQAQSSSLNMVVDCSIMRTSPLSTRGTPSKKSFIDAGLRTPVGTLVSTKPPSPVTTQPIKQDASQRSTKPTQDASQRSLLASPTASAVAGPFQVSCGRDTSRPSLIVSTTASLSQACCGGDASQRGLIVSSTAGPSETQRGGDASQRTSCVSTTASPSQAHPGGQTSQQSLIDSTRASLRLTRCGDASQRIPAVTTSEATCSGSACQQNSTTSSVASPLEAQCTRDAVTAWLIGVSGPLPSGEDLAERLRAVAPEVYED